MSWQPGEPRFLVREIEGYELHSNRQTFLSVSVLDAAYNYEEVARFSQENVRLFHRAADGRHNAGEASAVQKREAIRNRAAGLAAMLEADHA